VQIKKDMKKNILLIVLCLAYTATFAQRKKKTIVKKKAATTAARRQSPAAQSTALSAQPTAPVATAVPLKPFDRPLDGYYKKADILNAKVTPYPNLREADVAFSKRVWREIDLRMKMNTYLSSPKSRLIDVLMTAIANGELTVYDATPDAKNDPDGDSFARPLTPEQAKSKMADSSVVDKFDKDGNKIGSTIVAGEFNPDSIVKFRIKEDWIFDRQRSIFEPRIIGLAPLIKPKAGSLDIDYQPAFWIYFPDARQVLSTKEVVNKHSDATGLSFDDVFMKRLFDSYIVKVSNDKDERIKDYAQGIDKLYEAEKVKKSLMDWELNLWQY
jgi:gliding motility associated protien GldN